MKRICSILCAAAMLLSAIIAVPAWGAASDDGVITNRQSLLLTELGITDGTEKGEESLTRAQAIKLILRAVNGTEQAPTGIFSDVPADSAYAGSIETAYRMGIVAGYPDGTFRPDAGIAYGEMLKLLLSVCGYSEYAMQKGGYPAGYLRCARDTWLTDGMGNRDAESMLTWQDGIILIYNALHIDLMEMVSVGEEESNYQIKKGYSLLNREFKLEVVRGLVTANDLTSLYDKAGAVTGGIAIDGKQYSADAKWGKYLGYEADAYVTERSEAVCLIPTDRNRVVSYTGNQVETAEKGQVTAYVGDDRNAKTFRIHSAGGFFKNGVYFANMETELVQPEDLKKDDVRYVLLDNNDDGKYDLVFAEAYLYYQVESVDKENRVINDKLENQIIELLPEDTLRYLDGRPASLDKVKYNDIIGVLLPEGEVLTKERDYSLVFTVIDGVVSGTATGNDAESVRIGSENYEINPARGLSGSSLNGQKGSFYLDACGKILIFERTGIDGAAQLAYISKMASTSSFGDQCLVQVLLQNGTFGEKEVSSRASVMMDGEVVTFDGKPVKGPDAIYAAKGLIVERLVKVWVNGEDKISRIELASQLPADTQGENNDFNYTAERTYKTRGSDVLSDIYRLPKTATVFTVPADGEDEDVFKVSTVSEISRGEDFTCELYGIDDSFTASAALVRQEDASQAAISVESSLFVVKNIGTALDEEGVETVAVTGVMGGEEKTYSFRDADAKARDWINDTTTVVPVRRNVRADELRFGDIIQISVSGDIIQSFRIMYLNPEYNAQGDIIRGDGEFARQGSDDSEEIFEWAGLQWPFVNKSMLFVNGKITRKDSDFFSMTVKDYKKNMFGNSLQNIYLADEDRGTIRTIPFNDRDFTAGKRVFVTIVWGRERDVVVYK